MVSPSLICFVNELTKARDRGDPSGVASWVLAIADAGLSLVSVGKQLGCDGSTVGLALQKAGVPRRNTHGRDR
jgi:hypothetical protein